MRRGGEERRKEGLQERNKGERRAVSVKEYKR